MAAKSATPCKDCGRRVVGCQSDCTDYTDFKQQLAAAKAAEFESRRGDMEFYGFAARSRARNLKEKRRKQK